ncbi:MAG TPA: hypothetical protein VGM86_17045 [Thermoanaerobaculia bacterium]|jgi:hypothetical protein
MRRTVQRGIVALAIVTSLFVAGASPAAAMDLGLMHQISRLWSFFAGAPSPAPAPHRSTTRKPVPGKATSCPSGSGSCEGGWGIDPNGNSLHSDPILPLSGG